MQGLMLILTFKNPKTFSSIAFVSWKHFLLIFKNAKVLVILYICFSKQTRRQMHYQLLVIITNTGMTNANQILHTFNFLSHARQMRFTLSQSHPVSFHCSDRQHDLA